MQRAVKEVKLLVVKAAVGEVLAALPKPRGEGAGANDSEPSIRRFILVRTFVGPVRKALGLFVVALLAAACTSAPTAHDSAARTRVPRTTASTVVPPTITTTTGAPTTATTTLPTFPETVPPTTTPRSTTTTGISAEEESLELRIQSDQRSISEDESQLQFAEQQQANDSSICSTAPPVGCSDAQTDQQAVSEDTQRLVNDQSDLQIAQQELQELQG